MLHVPTALLLHRTPTGSHHDWLVGGPDYRSVAGSRLWTARLGPASSAWHAVGRFEMQAQPAHRRAYLTYQGPISGGRGTVVRVDQGRVALRRWSDGRMLWDVRMRHFDGRIEAVRLSDDRWRAKVLI